MAFNLVLPQMLPCAKLFAALFARVLHAPTPVFRVLFRHIVADKPLCYPYQATTQVVSRSIWIFGSYFKKSVKTLQQTVSLHFFCVGRNITPYDVSPVGLKVPWGN
jgi:hypothetical protein